MAVGRAGGKYTGVQALRFVAALLVVLTHATLYTSERLDSSVPVWHFGEVGVDVFFVISGFVMMVSTRSLIGDRNGWKSFSMRRIIRIVPMYWIATTIKLAVLVAVPAAVLHATLNPATVLLSYGFLPSRNVDGLVQPLLGVGWTLTFEMFFYFVFALALFLRANRLYLAGIVLTACAVGWLFRGTEWPPAAVYLDPIVLNFLVGMIIGRWALDRSARNCALGLGYVLVLWAVLYAVQPEDGAGFAYHGFVRSLLVTALVLAVVALDPIITGRIPSPVIFMGDASYSLYLFHPLVAPIVPATMAAVGLTSVPVSLALSVTAAVVAAAFVYRVVERPLTAWLRRRMPYASRARAPQATAPATP